MQEVIYTTNLIITGTVHTGPDGIIEAKTNVTQGHKGSQSRAVYASRIAHILGRSIVLRGDFDISGKKVIVYGGVFIYGDRIQVEDGWTGHITAGGSV